MDSIEQSGDTTAAIRSTPAVTELAYLMHDVGIAVDENYGCEETTSNLTNDKNGLVYVFGYSNDAAIVSYDNTSYSTAGTAIVQQIKNGWPVIMRGDDGGSDGHCWVCDGCQTELQYSINYIGGLNIPDTTWYTTTNCYYLSMNWGRNGEYDGWYEYDDFEPLKYIYNFSYNNYMIINVHP